MSLFTKPLLVTPYPDGKTWCLMEDFSYAIGSENSRNRVDVPKGFTTDFASIPSFLWFALPKWGKYGNAAVIHDYLYYDQSTTRLKADNIFLEAMMVLEVPVWQRFSLYTGVRIAGWWAWWLNSRKKDSGYSKIVKACPLKSVDQPGHWKTKLSELPTILRGKKTEEEAK